MACHPSDVPTSRPGKSSDLVVARQERFSDGRVERFVGEGKTDGREDGEDEEGASIHVKLPCRTDAKGGSYHVAAERDSYFRIQSARRKWTAAFTANPQSSTQELG